eukprot:gene7511-9008_t
MNSEISVGSTSASVSSHSRANVAIAEGGSAAHRLLTSAQSKVIKTFSVLKLNAATGAVLQQVSVTVAHANVSCNSLVASPMSLVLTCSVQNAIGSAPSAVVLATNRDLSFKKLPAGWARSDTISITPVSTPFVATSFAAPAASKVIPTSSFTYSTLGQTPTWRPTTAPTIASGSDDAVPSTDAQNEEDGMSQTVVIGMIGASAALGFGLCALLLCALCSYKIKKNREKYLQKHGNSDKVLLHPDNTVSILKTELTRTKTSDTSSVTFPTVSLPVLTPISSGSSAFCSSPASSSHEDSGSDMSDNVYHKRNVIQKVSQAPQYKSSQSDEVASDEDYSYSSYTSTSSSSVNLSSLHDSEMSDAELSIKHKSRAQSNGLHTLKSTQTRKSIAPSVNAAKDTHSRSSSSVVLSSLHSSERSHKAASDKSSSVVLSSLHDSEMSDTELSVRYKKTKRNAAEEGLHTPKQSRARRKTLAPSALPNKARSGDDEASRSSSSVVLSSLHSSERSHKSASKKSSSVVLSSLHSSERSIKDRKKAASEESSSVALSSLHSSEMSEKSGKKYKTHRKDTIPSIDHPSDIAVDKMENGPPPAANKHTAPAPITMEYTVKNDDSSFDSDFDEMLDELSDDSSWGSSSAGDL